MRRVKTNRLILLAAVLAIVLGVLSWLQTGQEETKKAIVAELEVATRREANLKLDGLKAKIEELKETQIQAAANASVLKEYFVSHASDLDVGETLYPIAREYRVNLRIFSSHGVQMTDFKGVSSAGLRLNLTVYGEVTDILDFIDRVHETYPLGQVNTITISNPPGGVRAATADDYETGLIYQAAMATLELEIQNYIVGDDSG